MRVRTFALAAALALTALTGCQKLNYEKTHSLPATSYLPVEFDPPRYSQKLTVTVKPTAAPVSAYVCAKENVEKIDRLTTLANKEPGADLVFGGARGKGNDEEITFEATVPAKTEFVLLLVNHGKKNEVSVKVVGR
jgi:hypothetical protein